MTPLAGGIKGKLGGKPEEKCPLETFPSVFRKSWDIIVVRVWERSELNNKPNCDKSRVCSECELFGLFIQKTSLLDELCLRLKSRFKNFGQGSCL
ncbi:hypothetical protein DdX_14361 [Ditylenchus destructor]|uniref:Uncharacterized protein n=1 Tax=Ditylenchus destructor TaxID=166010 RepID=A0AAD4MUB3_9BILA|nr:hypothetical protein DdX_14361 [Ditylenchus destructor]